MSSSSSLSTSYSMSSLPLLSSSVPSLLGTISISTRLTKLLIIFLIFYSVHSIIVQACISTNDNYSEFKYDKNSINKQEDNLRKFSQFLLERYRWEMSVEDVRLLNDAYLEYQKLYLNLPTKNNVDNISKSNSSSQQNKTLPLCLRYKPKVDLDKKYKKFPSISTVQNLIKDRKDTAVLISASSTWKSYKKPKHNRLYSRYEAKIAWNATDHFQNPQNGLCASFSQQPTSSFCVKTYFQENHHKETEDIIQFYPPSLLLRRCSYKPCHCIQKDHECLPTGTAMKEFYTIGIDQKYLSWTWAFFFTEHTGCKCQHRCHNRRCVKPFKLEISRLTNNTETCHCKCEAGKERICKKILDGKKKFSSNDHYCIMNGRCIKPDCNFGPLTEESLYDRHCPSLDSLQSTMINNS